MRVPSNVDRLAVLKSSELRFDRFDLLSLLQMHEQRYQRWMTATDLRVAMAKLSQESSTGGSEWLSDE